VYRTGPNRTGEKKEVKRSKMAKGPARVTKPCLIKFLSLTQSLGYSHIGMSVVLLT
jgi:hypothetical protein